METVPNAYSITKKKTRCLTVQGNPNECKPTVTKETRTVAKTSRQDERMVNLAS
ncbi:MAG: hypothetical protein ACQCN3_08240 [Candidatus Bathyarchaeia archaeon]